MAPPGCHQPGRCKRTVAGAHGGGGCAPEEHVPRAAATWGVRASQLNVAERQPEANREKPDEQRVDVLNVIPYRLWR